MTRFQYSDVAKIVHNVGKMIEWRGESFALDGNLEDLRDTIDQAQENCSLFSIPYNKNEGAIIFAFKIKKNVLITHLKQMDKKKELPTKYALFVDVKSAGITQKTLSGAGLETTLKPLLEGRESVPKQPFAANYQVFFYQSLMFNLAEHKLARPHHIMTPAEVKEVKQVYNIEANSNFPAIHASDPWVKYIHARTDNIIRIERMSVTAGSYSYYRRVIPVVV